MEPSDSDPNRIRIGLFSAIGAHLLWGVFPLFWRQFGDFDPLQIVCHRICWSFVFLLVGLPFLVAFTSPEQRQEVAKHVRDPKSWLIYALAGFLIVVNWLTFVWAVNNDRVLDTSLGYYINPLLTVVCGVWVLGERLKKLQWLAVLSAAIGVTIMTIGRGALPWVSLILGVSFTIYSLVKKKAPLPALFGLMLETAAIFLPALAFVIYIEAFRGNGVFESGDTRLVLLLMLGGTVTIAPLALFAFAANRAPLAAIGVLQYIAPTMQFIIGFLVLDEPFDRWQLFGFIFVWAAVVLYLTAGNKKSTE